IAPTFSLVISPTITLTLLSRNVAKGSIYHFSRISRFKLNYNYLSSSRTPMKLNIIPVRWTHEGVEMLDQRLLPTEEKWLMMRSYNEVADGIRDMVVRGAPAIGVSAAYGMALGAKQFVGTTVADLGEELEYVGDVLAKTRPTAVNLFWAIDRMKARSKEAREEGNWGG